MTFYQESLRGKMGIKDYLYQVQQGSDKFSPVRGDFFERKNVLDLKILVCLDVSGSISPQQFKQFMSRVDLIRGVSVVKVLEIDDKVIALYDYFQGNHPVVRLQGGGSTDFTDAFEVAKRMRPHVIVFLTDGQVNGQKVLDPNIPTAWVLTHDGVFPSYGFGDEVERLPEV
jgi:predicted metal-dependent peptidase